MFWLRKRKDDWTIICENEKKIIIFEKEEDHLMTITFNAKNK